MRLPDADRGEERAERDERHEERAREPVGDRAASHRREARDEREHEERERDSSGSLVPRPEERRRGQGHERGERQREQERGRGRSLTAQDPVREREHGGGDGEVEREEQEGLVVAELYGHAERCNCEECDGNGRRVARERHGADDRCRDAHRHERDSSGIFQQELHVVVADEGPREAAGGHPEEPEPGEREDAAARDQREHGAERSDERRDLGELGVLHRPRRYATSD